MFSEDLEEVSLNEMKKEILEMVNEEVLKTKSEIIEEIVKSREMGESGMNVNVEDLPPPPPPRPHINGQKNRTVVEEEEVEDSYNWRQGEWEEEKQEFYSYNHPTRPHDTYEDTEYFNSYAKISLHHEMVFDKRRTAAYYHAIMKSKDLFKDKVVLDVGCGTGVLSCFCAKAGAKKVYSVEASDMYYYAELNVNHNGLQDKIQLIKGKLEEITFPEFVDIIVSEWMGSFLIFESMLESVIYARDYLLKDDGVLFPSKASMYLAPIRVDSYYDNNVTQWSDVFGLDFSPLIPLAKEEYTEKSIRNYYIEDQSSVLDKPIVIRTLDLKTITIKDLEKTMVNFSFTIPKGRFHGYGTWFSVYFEGLDRESDQSPEEHQHYFIDRLGELQVKNHSANPLSPTTFELKSNTLELSTSPGDGDTHWKQVLFLFDSEISVASDTTQSNGTMRVTQHRDYRRHWWIELFLSTRTKPPHNFYRKYLI